jgi:hypothetical protein
MAEPVDAGPDTVDCAPNRELACRSYAELVWAFWTIQRRTQQIQEPGEKQAA